MTEWLCADPHRLPSIAVGVVIGIVLGRFIPPPWEWGR